MNRPNARIIARGGGGDEHHLILCTSFYEG